MAVVPNTRRYATLVWISFAIFLTVISAAPACQSPPTIQFKLSNCTLYSADKNHDVYSWGIQMGISGSNEICIVPSTVSNSTILTATGLCGNDQLRDGNQIQMTERQCLSRRGGLVDINKVPPASIDGLDDLNPGWFDLTGHIDKAASATLELDQDTITMVEPLVTQGQLLTQSHLGLAAGAPILDILKERGEIGARSWGLNSGSQSYLSPRSGSLVLGGYDSASRDGRFYDFPVKNRLNEKRYCPLQLHITSMTATISNATQSTSKDIVQVSDPFDVCIEPYDNLFRIPDTKVELFTGLIQTFVGKELDTIAVKDYEDELLNLEPGIVYPSNFGNFNITLRITIDDDRLTVEIPAHEFQRPLRGLDKDGRPFVDPSRTELQIYGYSEDESAGSKVKESPVFGKAFLSQLYLYVDYESMLFYLARQNVDISTPIAVSSVDCGSLDEDGGLSPTTKGLIGVGVVVGVLVLVLVLLGYCFFRRGEVSRSSLSWGFKRPTPRGVGPPFVKAPTPEQSTGEGAGDGNGVPLGPVSGGGGAREGVQQPGVNSPSQPAVGAGEHGGDNDARGQHSGPSSPGMSSITSNPKPAVRSGTQYYE